MGNTSAKNARRYSSSTGSNSKRIQWGGQGLPAPPGKPILIAASSEDSHPDIVGIRWERSPSNGGSAIVGYLVEHRRLGSPHWVRSSPNLCSFPELTLSGLEPGWRYQFRVRAQNNLGLSQPSELSDPLTVTLQRSAASAPRFDLELKDTIALENEQAEFIVHFSGTPIPKISWFKDGFEIFSSRRTRIVTENGKSTLLIHQTALNDEGEIKCTATNRAGHVSTRANLILEAPPRIRLPRQYEDGLLFEQDETVRLKVSVAGRPSPNVAWFHDGEIIKADDRHILEALDSGECSMKIPAAKRKDRGEYTVKAINKLGEDVTSFLVTVTDRPASPGKATIAMTLGRSVTLSWQEPEDDGGCKIGTYIVEYYRIGWDVWLKAATCRQPMTTLSELIEGSEYKFRVKAENPYGVSDPSVESDVIFIPDPKRGINSPPLRPDKSQSQREIHRGRSERRQDEPTKRTRSLTREEAIRANNNDFQTPPSRSASAQRLVSGAPMRPARVDSRVTFSDTVYLHVEKPLQDDTPVAPIRPRSKRDKIQQVTEDEDKRKIKREVINPIKITSNPTLIARQPSFDDSGGNSIRPAFREKSPSPIPMIQIQQSSTDESTNSKLILPREADMNEVEEENDDERFRGSSEFMLVLYPEEESGNKIPFERSALENEVEDDDEDLVPPPMSLSLPELFSADHQIVEVLREAVSSTELLHERAMERFYKAVAIEEAEAAKNNDSNSSQKPKEALNFSSGRLRNSRIRRLPSSSSPTQSGGKMKWIYRRASDSQASPKNFRGVPATLLLPAPKLVASDPNLPQDSIIDEEFPNRILPITPSTSASTSLHRWDEKTMPLIPQQDPDNLARKASKDSLTHLEPLMRDVKTPDRQCENDSLNADDYTESTDEETDESEISDSSEDLKTLKSRLLAQPIVDEQDTYHPRGRPTPYVSSPEPDYKIILDVATQNKPGVILSNVTQPKSILKKRSDEEPVPVNRFGRPIPPENSVEERQNRSDKLHKDDNNDEPVIEEPAVIMRKKSLTDVTNAMKETVMAELDSENASLLNVAEVAKNRRRPNQKPVLEKKPSIEEQEDLEARKAVIDHYTELVKEYSISHAVHPPAKWNSNGTISHGTKLAPKKVDTEVNSNQMKSEENVTVQKEDVSRSRKNTAGSRGPTPSRDDTRPSRKASRNESSESRSRNVSTERKSGRSISKTRAREVSQDRQSSRSSSRTRKHDVPHDKEISKSSRSSSRQRSEIIPQRKSSSRANSKERFKSFDISPSDSETSQRMSQKKSNNYRLERSRRSSSRTIERMERMKSTLSESNNGINDRLVAEANINVKSTMNYIIDLTIFIAAVYVYLFKKEILAIPLIGLLLYRRIQQDINEWIPKWWKGKPRRH
ncbi:hypothetical protein PV328_001734 [Microctonus aethiopoides]|uniref:Titin n=1 Tax=Microctonus aethiopoides TaxID=144406 RepID=A0AA39FYU7_9HYME|nr:hypothetical protein PV328_001734 [Microctonus aethiopoides]